VRTPPAATSPKTSAAGALHLVDSGKSSALSGRAGNDYIDGGGGNDLIDGGDGNDHLIGGRGRDILRGGEGNDRIDAADGERDLIDCGGGVDTVDSDMYDVLSNCELVRRHAVVTPAAHRRVLSSTVQF
jgi:Ca2+-binding RTX toxin-like protein